MTECLDFAAAHPFMATLWVWSGVVAAWGFRPLVLANFVRRDCDCGCRCDESTQSDE